MLVLDRAYDTSLLSEANETVALTLGHLVTRNMALEALSIVSSFGPCIESFMDRYNTVGGSGCPGLQVSCLPRSCVVCADRLAWQSWIFHETEWETAVQEQSLLLCVPTEVSLTSLTMNSCAMWPYLVSSQGCDTWPWTKTVYNWVAFRQFFKDWTPITLFFVTHFRGVTITNAILNCKSKP